MDRKVTITLVGKGQAEVGVRFLHKGATDRCRDCQYKKVCVDNLDSERIYEIVKVRDRRLFCKAYQMDMVVVEVVEADVDAAIPVKLAIEGATITFKEMECNRVNCENYELCFPKGLRDGDKVTIINVSKSLPCPLGFSLKVVRLRRVPS